MSLSTIKAQQCVSVASHWVRYFILTCDLKLAVQFYDGHHPHHPRVHHPKPDVCCYYPNTNVNYFNLAIASDPGRFVHAYLYKKLPYLRIKPPCPAVNCCTGTSTQYPTLSATLVNVAGCSCVAGTYSLPWDSSVSAWRNTAAFLVCGGKALNLTVTCSGNGVWQISGDCAGSSFYTNTQATQVQAFPNFSLTFPEATVSAVCCSGGMGNPGTISVTVTA
jgi:hypothetical protein